MSWTISSMQNRKIKDLRVLQAKSRERRETGLMVIDGWKEILMAHEAGYYIQQLFVRDGSTYMKEINALWQDYKPETMKIFHDVFDKLSYRGVTSGAIAVAEAKSHHLEDIKLSENPVVLVLDAVEKPGNLGAMIRTADATGIDAVICCDTATDVYNPNVIRSSVGCVFSVPIAVASREETLAWLQKNSIQILTTSLQASVPYTQMDFRLPTAFVLGTEASGVDVLWEEESTQNIILPMLGRNDSLNVSNTAAVLLYEMLRQRNL